jgi:hypothetical protein
MQGFKRLVTVLIVGLGTGMLASGIAREDGSRFPIIGVGAGLLGAGLVMLVYTIVDRPRG